MRVHAYTAFLGLLMVLGCLGAGFFFAGCAPTIEVSKEWPTEALCRRLEDCTVKVCVCDPTGACVCSKVVR